MATPSAFSSATQHVARRAPDCSRLRHADYDLDGTWYEPMYQTLPPVLERIRKGHGPALIEGEVIRIDPHSSPMTKRSTAPRRR